MPQTVISDKKFVNNTKIEWPPGKTDLSNLVKSMNLKLSDRHLHDCLVYCRGPKLEHFSFERLINWF